MKNWPSTGAEIIFWACLFLVIYTYLLYPVLLFLAYALSQARRDWLYLVGRRNRRRNLIATGGLPSVNLIVAAHNEELHLPDKIANIRRLDYPREKLESIFVSDGSTDRTNEILAGVADASIRTYQCEVRRGKASALNLAASHARLEILVFSDAATLFAPDALKNLVRHFSDPTVGVVCGRLEFEGTAESHQTEGVYWKYETLLRMMEARLGATLTASGALFALRRECYSPLTEDTLVDDLMVPMRARKLGYRVIYDPEATATDFAATSVANEFKRRVRLAIGSFKALGELVRTPIHGFTRVAFFSHKVLRWVLPFPMLALLVTNAFLLDSDVYRFLFAGQLMFYTWAGSGFLFREKMQRVRFGLVGYFLLAIHLAFLVGFFRYVLGREEGAWQRVT